LCGIIEQIKKFININYMRFNTSEILNPTTPLGALSLYKTQKLAQERFHYATNNIRESVSTKVVDVTEYLRRNFVTAFAEKILGRNTRTFVFKLADGSPATMIFRGVKADASLVKGLDEAFRINPEIFNSLINPDVKGTNLTLFDGTKLEISKVNSNVSRIITGGVAYELTFKNGNYTMSRAA
jgi:hypothetical protein